MNLLELAASLSLDSSGFDNGLSDAVSSAGSFAANIGGKLAAGAKAGADALLKLGEMAASATGALVAQAAQTAETADNIDKMSQKIGISAEAYQEWDFILQHSGSSADGLQTAIRTLNAQIAKALGVINDTDDAVAELDEQFTTGKISLEEYNQKYDELYANAYKDIDAFDRLGFSMADLESLSTEEILTKIIEGLQGMEEGTERTSIATTLLGRSAQELGPLLNTSAAETAKMRAEAHKLGGVLSNEAVKAGARFEDSLQNLNTAIDGIKNGIGEAFLPALSDMMDGISELLSGDEGGLDKLTEGIINFADTAAEKIPEVVDTVVAVATQVLDAVSEKLPEIIEVIIEALPTIINSVMLALDDIIDAITGALPQLIEATGTIIGALATAIINNAPKLLESVVGAITQILQTFTDNMPQILDKGVEIIQQLGHGIAQALPQLIPQAVNAITTLCIGLTEPDRMSDLIDTALEIILALADGLIKALPQLVAAIPKICSQLIATIINKLPEFLAAGGEIMFGIIYGIQNSLGALWDAMKEAVQTVKDALGEPLQILYDAGRYIIEGLWNGISSAGDWLSDKVGGFFGDMYDGITDFFGIASPSKKMKWVGDMLGEGMALGIEEGTTEAINAAEEMTAGIFDALGTDEKGALEVDMANPSNIVIQVYGAEGQSEEQIAEQVSERLNDIYNRGRAVFA